MPTRFDLIIFDCDGVVVDSEPITHRVFGEMLVELGLEMSLSDMYQQFLGRSLRDCLAYVEERLGRPVPQQNINRYLDRRDAALRAEVQPVCGIRSILERLDAPYCLASSGDHAKMRASLGATGLLQFFEGRIFSATEVPNAKPAPDVFLYAARTMGVKPSRTAVVEDTVNGVLAGRAAAMTVYGYSALTSADRLTGAGAAATFTQMSQLPGILGATAQ